MCHNLAIYINIWHQNISVTSSDDHVDLANVVLAKRNRQIHDDHVSMTGTIIIMDMKQIIYAIYINVLIIIRRSLQILHGLSTSWQFPNN